MKRSIRFTERLFRFLPFRMAAIVFWASQAHAVTYNWTPTAAGTSYNWDNSGGQNNWGTGSGGLFLNAVDATANLTNNLTGNQTIRLNQAITIGTLNIGDTGSSYYATTLHSGVVGGLLIFDVNSGSAVINKALTANTATDIIIATITLNDDISITNASTVGSGLTISGNIGESVGAKALAKRGAGLVTLSGANSYTGVTTISEGTLSVGTIGDGGVASNLGSANNAASNLVFNGGTLKYTGATASTNRNFTINSGKTATFNITTNNLTVSGASTASDGALTKTGYGTLTLSGANAYTGLTTVSGGRLVYGADNVIASGGVTVNGGILDLGAFIETVGTVTVGGNNGQIIGSGTLTSIGTFEMKQGSVTAILGGNGIPLNKTTAGTLTLSGANTYTGKTTVNDGILQLNGPNGAIAGKNISINHGSLVIDNTSESLSAWTYTTDWMGPGNIVHFAPAPGTFCILASSADLVARGIPSPTLPSYVLLTEDASLDTSGLYGYGTPYDHAVLVEPQSNGSLNCRFVWQNPGAAAYTTVFRPDGSVFYTTSWPNSNSMLTCPSWTVFSGNNNNPNRIADDSTIALNGGSLVFIGTDKGNSSETIGNISGTGNSTVTVSYSGTMVAELTAASFGHEKTNGSNLVNGANLGQNSTGNSMGRFFITAAPTLVGTAEALDTGINPIAHNTKIVPFLIGKATSTTGGTGTATGIANTFVTYSSAGGLRPLNPTDEFTNNAIATGNNTRITSATTVGSTATINSLVIDGADLTLVDGTTLTNTSGAFLFVSTHEIKASALANPGRLAVGSATAEYMVTVNAGVTGTISAGLTSVTGTECLTKSGVGTLILSGVNTYGGDTAVTAGTLSITHLGLPDLAAVRITAGAVLDLNFSSTDTVGSLWLDGLNMGLGTFDATTQPLYFTGTGVLVVVPEPSTLVLLGIGAAGLLGYVWRRRRV